MLCDIAENICISRNIPIELFNVYHNFITSKIFLCYTVLLQISSIIMACKYRLLFLKVCYSFGLLTGENIFLRTSLNKVHKNDNLCFFPMYIPLIFKLYTLFHCTLDEIAIPLKKKKNISILVLCIYF